MWGSIHGALWAQAVECLTEESSVVALSVSLTKLSDDTIRHHCHFSSLTLSLLFILSLIEIHISIYFISSISNARTCSPGSSDVSWDSGALTIKYVTVCLESEYKYLGFRINEAHQMSKTILYKLLSTRLIPEWYANKMLERVYIYIYNIYCLFFIN